MNLIEILTPLLADTPIGVRVSAASRKQDIPPYLQALHDSHQASEMAKAASGATFNGPVVLLRNYQLTETGLHLDVQPSTYVSMSAARKTAVDALKTGALSWERALQVPQQFGACFCAAVMVLTSDHKILTIRRSALVSDAGRYTLALGEVLEPKDFAHGSQSLHAAGARALSEELNVALSPRQAANYIRPMYLARAREGGAWVILLVADFRNGGATFAADAILANAGNAPDAWESDHRSSIAYSPCELQEFLVKHQGGLALWAEDLVTMLLKDFPPH